ncbi:MAG: hypothetical protein A2677_02735 [Candidatus Komeilibacteria bacterium RIFCSPHIGHO2_01_FULL_52_14]|uniref:Uncharacterized protein n=1 Tax=Candidatus Komeilibacteria bacterium RIFCSPHIGHO2_01_FULL_52_14 TaxID=1798549 RepID=A0A1G2BI81_9BACT|nr:MAG: hypothetical protein A2677_02735 [Candidatus Komeilibacteria bacterium RIFCSPHIGHO2_01_FULL_52_14]
MLVSNLFKRRKASTYILRNVYEVLGIVLIWRGIWYVLDALDTFVFGGTHEWTAIAGVVAGVLLLYLPDRNLKAIERL